MLLLDTNTLIEAHRLYYSFTIAPGFWTWIEQQHEHGRIASVPAVRNEIQHALSPKDADDLDRWSRTLPSTFWIEPTAATVTAIGEAVAWVQGRTPAFIAAAQDTFLRSADLYLIAEAKSGNHTVVTREHSEPAARKRVFIPDVCRALTTRCIGPFEAYSQLGLRLVEPTSAT